MANILIVDDEPRIRDLIREHLQYAGFTCQEAGDGTAALSALSQGGIDLVILDMLMPSLSGEKVFFRLKALSDAVRVLLISGYASEDAVNNVLSNGGLDFIQKPFTRKSLARMVRLAIDRA